MRSAHRFPTVSVCVREQEPEDQSHVDGPALRSLDWFCVSSKFSVTQFAASVFSVWVAIFKSLLHTHTKNPRVDRFNRQPLAPLAQCGYSSQLKINFCIIVAYQCGATNTTFKVRIPK